MMRRLLSALGPTPIKLEPVLIRDESGEELVTFLEKEGVKIAPKAREILVNGTNWPVQRKGGTFRPIILPDRLLGQKKSNTEEARLLAKELGLITEPAIHLAPLLRVAISDNWMKEKGMRRLVVPHAYIPGKANSGGQPQRLYLGLHSYDGGNYLAAFADYEGFNWGKGVGWVFDEPLALAKAA